MFWPKILWNAHPDQIQQQSEQAPLICGFSDTAEMCLLSVTSNTAANWQQQSLLPIWLATATHYLDCSFDHQKIN